MPNSIRNAAPDASAPRRVWRSRIERFSAVLVCSIGLWLSLDTWLPVLLNHSSGLVQPVRAQVVESRFQGDSRSRWSLREKRPIFAYRYVHQGRLFHASGYRPDGGLAEAVRRFPPGTMVTAYLDPARPQSAMLFPGVQGEQLATGLIGLVLLLSGGLFVQRTWRVDDQPAPVHRASLKAPSRPMLKKEPGP